MILLHVEKLYLMQSFIELAIPAVKGITGILSSALKYG
jgi:hypothetical protein